MRCSASRLLVHNLFTCCGVDENYFHVNLNQITYDTIQMYIAQTNALLEKANNVDGATSLFPLDFKNKLEEMKKAADDGGKSRDYFLMSIFKTMQNAYYRISSFENKQPKPNVPPSDIALLNEFKELLSQLFNFNGVESISYKTLHDVLSISEKGFVKKQDTFVRFLLGSIFPRIIVPPYDAFLNLLTGYTWEDFIVVDSKLTVNDINMDELTGMALCYGELFDLKSTDYESIGKKLLELYDASLKCRLVSDEDLVPPNKNVKNSVEVQGPLIFDDAAISTHIIGFMRWIPVIAEESDGLERMEFVEHVLDRIRNEVCEKIQERYAAKDFMEIKTNLFIQKENDDLRELLIRAMSHEQYFYRCFRKYYEVTCLNYVGGIFNE